MIVLLYKELKANKKANILHINQGYFKTTSQFSGCLLYFCLSPCLRKTINNNIIIIISAVAVEMIASFLI